MQKLLNGVMLRKMVISAAQLLDINRQYVDALNVFPVPDGDTGTNMSLTIVSARKALEECKSNSIKDIADAVSRGALKGARGNSGVILSQIFKGFFNSFKEEVEIDTKRFAKALKNGCQVAYNAVNSPKEGTILTVIRMVAEFADANYSKNKDFEEFIPQIIESAQVALDKTPELLPVLKQAGVVDAGGMGLLFILKGFQKALMGEEIEEVAQSETEQKPQEADISDHADISMLGNIEFAYCTEFFIINLHKKTTLADIDKLREKLSAIGDSVICIGDLELVKVHVHTNQPGVALSYALELGELDKPKIENMLEQNRQLLAKFAAEKKEMGMLSICSGKGLEEIFKDLMVDRVIEGGQTMNPSASDIADAIMRINADIVFVFPNNKNIILAAEQSKSLVENKTIHVIPSKNIPQGIAAALSFNSELNADENKINMIHALDNVTSGQVTHAVRATSIDGFELKVGDIIGLDAKKILAKGETVDEVCIKLIEEMKESYHELITLYYGSDVKEEDAEALLGRLETEYPDCEVAIRYGGQPIYYYIISME